MAAVPIAIRGRLFDVKNKTEQNVFLIGLSHNPTLEIGGGPIIPPEQVPPPDLIIWSDPGGYNEAHPGEPWPPEQPPNPPFTADVIWTPEKGWQVVLTPTGEHVTPSGQKQSRR